MPKYYCTLLLSKTCHDIDTQQFQKFMFFFKNCLASNVSFDTVFSNFRRDCGYPRRKETARNSRAPCYAPTVVTQPDTMSWSMETSMNLKVRTLFTPPPPPQKKKKKINKTNRSNQTVQTQISLLLLEQAGQGLHCVPTVVTQPDTM